MGAKNRLPYIDGLRAVAVLSVLSYHTALNSARSASVIGMIAQGQHGVDLFFVLSGFCLAYPTLSEKQRDGRPKFDILRYAIHRIVRIVPTYWAAITLFTILALCLHAPIPRPMPQHGFTTIDVVRQALFLGEAGRYLNGDFWTLALEFRWYFVFPILLWVWIRWPLAFALIGLVCPALLLSHVTADIGVFVLPAFMLGIVAAHVQVIGHRAAQFASPALAVMFPFALLTAAPFAGVVPAWQIVAFLFVVSAGSNRGLSHLLSSRWLVTIGVASYSIYLVHDPLLWLLIAHSVPVPVAITGGIAAGFTFWWIAERPFVESTIRTRLIAWLERNFTSRIKSR